MAYVLRGHYDPDPSPCHAISRLEAQSAHDTAEIYVRLHKIHGSANYANALRRTAIVPIGVMFSFSLIFGNVAYMYLSVSFIQMLKVRGNNVYLIVLF